MQLSIAGQSAYVEHNGETLEFNIKPYTTTSNDKQKFVDISRFVFREVNGYLVRTNPILQDDLFRIYKEMKDCLESTPNVTMLRDTLRELVTEFYGLIDYNAVAEYVVACTEFAERGINSDIAIYMPPNPQIEFTLNDREELTYLKHHSVELIGYLLYIRFIYPVLGEFMAVISNDVGNRYKEFFTLALFRDTEAVDSPAYTKLQAYANFLLEPSNIDKVAVYDGLGSEQIMELLTAMTIIRRLTNCELSTTEMSQFVVSQAYKFFNNSPKYINRLLGGSVKDNKSTSKDERNDSVIELLRARDAIAMGSIKIEELAFRDLVKGAKMVYPDIIVEYIEAFNVAMEHNPEFVRENFQYCILEGFVNRVISVPSLDHISFECYKGAVVIVQAILYQLGFEDIAAYMSATRLDHVPPRLNGSFAKLSKDIHQAILVKYPHYVNDIRDNNNKKTNPVIVDEIEGLLDDIIRSSWEFKTPNLPAYKDRPTQSMSAPTNLRVQLANMIIAM